jgi:hypothetical protein
LLQCQEATLWEFLMSRAPTLRVDYGAHCDDNCSTVIVLLINVHFPKRFLKHFNVFMHLNN